jgi:hypothetical protein
LLAVEESSTTSRSCTLTVEILLCNQPTIRRKPRLTKTKT